jgi:hypothetical protein
MNGASSGKDIPPWLALAPGLLDMVLRWVNEPTYAGEKAFLRSHLPELQADPNSLMVAFDEVSLVAPRPAKTYRALWNHVNAVGIDEAYRPILAREILRQWIGAPLREKRSMLSEGRAELLSDDVAGALRQQLEVGERNAATVFHVHLFNLALASRDALAFAAIDDASSLVASFTLLVGEREFESLDGLAQLLLLLELPVEPRASALFHHALASIIRGGDEDEAIALASEARDLTPEQVNGWLLTLLRLATDYPEVIGLSAALQAPVAPSGGEDATG